MRRLFKKRIILYSIILLLVLGVVTVIFTPDLIWFKRGSRFAIHFMLAYLAMGLLFFVVHSRMLMYSSMLCCLSLAIYLQNSTDDLMEYAETTQGVNMQIAHFNVSEFSSSYEDAITLLKNLDADVLSFQEVTPDWAMLLINTLTTRYPFRHDMVRIDPFGQAIFSRYPILDVDTVVYRSIPSLKLKLQVDEKDGPICLMSSYALPALDRYSYLNLKDQLYNLAEHVQISETPVIIVGDFNIEPWSNEIQDFKYTSNMQDSRRALVSASFNGFIPNFRVPEENIFYTNEIECTKFDPVLNTKNQQVGIIGIYQFKTLQVNKPRLPAFGK